MNLNGEAFILRTLSYSDADLIVHSLSKQHGLLHFFVRGAKKSKKRFSGGVLQPPHLINFETNSVKPDQLEAGSLLSLKEASLIQDFAEIRADYKSIEAMFSMIKVMLFSETGHEELFNHYGASLKFLPRAQSKRRFFTHFVVRYLYIEGVLPEQHSFSDFIRTPMGLHDKLVDVTPEQVEKEVGLANHFLKSYSSSREGVKWPN